MAIEAAPLALAPVAHLGIVEADPAIGSHALAQRRLALRCDRDILELHLGSRRQGYQHGRCLEHHLRLCLQIAMELGQGVEHTAQGNRTGVRVVPVQVKRRLERAVQRQPNVGVGRRRRQPPPLLAGNHAQRLPQYVAQKVIGVFDPTSAPQWAAVQGGAQLPAADRLGYGRPFHGALKQAPVGLRGDQALAKGDQGRLTERWFTGVQTVEHQLPASIHGGAFNHFVIGHTSVGLQDGGQRQLGGRNGRLAARRIFIEMRQFLLERRIKQGMAFLTQEDEEAGALDALDNGLFKRRQLHGRAPYRWLHRAPPCSTR